MLSSSQIVQILKQQLKQSGIRYRDLAKRLDLSESAVKQMFASENFSLKRLDQLCEILQIDIGEIVSLSEAANLKMECLEEKQEAELVTDTKLLLVAYSLINFLSVDEILSRYAIEETEMILLLAKLDKMKLIELLPGNRVRLLIATNFKWISKGPIETFFRNNVQQEFLQGSFTEDGAIQIVKNGDLTERGKLRIIERIKSVGVLFDDIVREDKKLKSDFRKGTSMILAIRNWEFAAFTKLQR